MDKFITFCRVEKDSFIGLVGSVGSVRYQAKKELFMIEYERFLRVFNSSNLSWDEFKNTLLY